jgi:hypothetical protein
VSASIGTIYRRTTATDTLDGMSPEPDEFGAALIELIGATRQVEIETQRPSGEPRRTIVWIVTDAKDVYVRSVRGSAGRWYRDLVANPNAALHLGGDRVVVRVTPAADPASVSLVSDLFRAKYGRTSRASTESMIRPHTLETTLRLHPTEPDADA